MTSWECGVNAQDIENKKSDTPFPILQPIERAEKISSFHALPLVHFISVLLKKGLDFFKKIRKSKKVRRD